MSINLSVKRIVCTLTLGTALSIPGFADLVSVTPGSAGALPGTALDLSADLSLTDITGTLDAPNGVAMFLIDIASPLSFAAETVPVGAFGVPDTELFLFDLSGNGVYSNDDKSGLDTLSCLPAFYANATPSDCPSSSSSSGPVAPGNYYLAITRSANSPRDFLNSYIFSPLLSTDVVGPNGGVGPIDNWDDGSFTSPDTDLINYHIVLSQVPEPAAWPVIAALGLALLVFRRRLRTT